MGSWPPADDEALLAELRVALRGPGEAPAEFLTAARAAFAWRTVDAELAVAELTFDSACDAAPAGLTRSGATARTLAFRAGPVVGTGPVLIEIEVTDAGIVGQLSPAIDGRITVGTAQGVYEETRVGPVGLFTLGVPPPGPVRLCAYTPRYALATSWVSLA